MGVWLVREWVAMSIHTQASLFQWENQHGQIYLYVSKTTGKEEESQTTHEVDMGKFLLRLHSKKLWYPLLN